MTDIPGLMTRYAVAFQLAFSTALTMPEAERICALLPEQMTMVQCDRLQQLVSLELRSEGLEFRIKNLIRAGLVQI